MNNCEYTPATDNHAGKIGATDMTTSTASAASSATASLARLKDVTQLFLQLTGGPSAQLCTLLLKTIDFLDDSVNNRLDEGEVHALTHRLAMCLGEALAEQSGATPRLQASLAWAKGRTPDHETCAILIADIRSAINGSNGLHCSIHKEQRQT